MEGLSLSLSGITVTFAALALLILIISLLERLFRKRTMTDGKEEPEERVIGSTLARDTTEEEVVAAIAVALSYLRSLDVGQSGLGNALEDGRGAWWTLGRLQQQATSRSRRQHGRG
jgi:sodium pump decarboxylase gamma subunit